ncbi:FAD-binding oxidoreductase [Nonomuraea basaltis]|uniref:FAD-binding oxidoreductase n=1 Tax=Nonomuraea basaltis TaxID=2495887 RepID=UPI001485CD7A|nr:FAD-binding oxidoreductase [Nonomuraea basaltis]
MNRRDFLRIAALAAPALTASQRQGPLERLGAPGRTGTAGTPPGWDRLRRRLAGTLVLPGDAGYEAARRVYNSAYDLVRPGGVAYCANPQDVSACLAFVRAGSLPFTVRSGGHSFAGASTGTGLVIDVSPLNGVAYAAGRATVGAGARLMHVYDRLAPHGVRIPAGIYPTVGIGGLTLGGGLGAASRKYGLTCDVLESVRIVTADGRLLACNAERHPELYWACRGGGGGNFGVALSFTFRTHEAREIALFYLRWPWSEAGAAVQAWQSWAPYMPGELWSVLDLKRDDDGPHVLLFGTHMGAECALDALLAPLTGQMGRPSYRMVRTVPYRDAMITISGCLSIPPARPRCVYGEAFAATSHMAYQQLPPDGVRTLVDAVERRGRHWVLLEAMGGAIGQVGPTATAFPHRAALYGVQYGQRPATGAQSLAGAGRDWIQRVRNDMSPYFGNHAYVNYTDPALTDWRTAYYGPNAARLAEVKTAYDPDRLFHPAQGV